jgi:hypothetical protein
MFDPLTAEELCRALAGLLRDSADTGASTHDDEGFGRSQLLAGSSLARLLAIEFGPAAATESELRRGIAAELDATPHGDADLELGSELGRLRTALTADGWPDEAGRSLARVLAILRQRPELDTDALSGRLRHVVRSSIDHEIAVFANAS